MSATKSEQGNRVQKELELLRTKQLAKNQRDKLQDLCGSPLTTPEEAQAFLAAMRDKSHERLSFPQPPSHLTSDGMDAWYSQQKQREKELRKRRREAEQLLHGFRGGGRDSNYGLSETNSLATPRESLGATVMSPQRTPKGRAVVMATPMSAVSQLSETLDDPTSFKLAKRPSEESDEEKKTEETDPQLDTTTPKPKEITVWRHFVSEQPGAKFAPEAGRYHLYLSYACPGSHRVLIVRALKGLEDAISVTYVHPTWRLTNPEDPQDKHRGWVFGDPKGRPFTNTIGRGGPFPPVYQGNEPDPIYDAFSMRDIYLEANDTSGKYTVPVLWDTKYKTIVNNESSDIAYMLNSCFNDFAKDPELDLYTEDDEAGVQMLNDVNDWMAPLMIHGVYRCGFAKTQRAYNKAISELCQAFDRADDILSRQRYLTGDTLTDVDIRLFVTLIRFDEVYAFYFRANARLVMLTSSLLNFCRDIYQIKGVADTCSMEQIKAHFYGSHAEWNRYSVIPRGLGFMELLELPHDRDAMYSDYEGDQRRSIDRFRPFDEAEV